MKFHALIVRLGNITGLLRGRRIREVRFERAKAPFPLLLGELRHDTHAVTPFRGRAVARFMATTRPERIRCMKAKLFGRLLAT
ncbi:MAG: hypothetical protein CVT73_19535 [Alphaproteobacteria bacterium HGW-Alphaproteobacteria-12]|nr:MAG: hypothetical protein CVT73_19535 [Alphaproteobacteria bacterium HGW-Alphaproteobacteria-12]